MPAERALNILGFEAKDKHVDQDLLDLFIDAKLYPIGITPQNDMIDGSIFRTEGF